MIANQNRGKKMTVSDISVASALELSRPKTSGPSVNMHVVQNNRSTVPNFEKMRKQIEGKESDSEKDLIRVDQA